MVNCTFEEAEKGGGLMKVYKTPSKDVQEIILANVTYETVIDGLNGYFASEPRNSYITVKMESDKQNFALYEAEAWADILIEWLRKKHDIFYRPGLILDQVEAARNAAKICCLRAHIKDEISKRGLWYDKDADIPELVDTLFRAYDECSKARDRNRENATKLSEVSQELRKERNTLKDTVSKVRSRLNKKFIPLPGYEDDLEKLVDIALRAVEARDETINRISRPWHDECEDIMNYIRQEASRNGFNLPEEIDDEPLTVKRVFHDLLELMRKRGAEIRIAEMETRRAVNEQLKKDTDYVADTLCDILEALGISKSNTAHLNIPGLKTKAIQRASVIKSEHGRYQEQLGKATADYKALSEEYQELKDSQKSDINELIRDCCAKHGIIAPSRYFSDKACVEYLVTAIEQKDRSFTILQDLYRDIFKKQPDGLSAEDIANKILDIKLDLCDTVQGLNQKVQELRKTYCREGYISDRIHEICTAKGVELDDAFLYSDDYTWEDLVGFLCEEIRKLKDAVDEECKGQAMVTRQETRKECYDYLWNALRKLSPDCDALKIDRYEDLVDRIFYEMSLVLMRSLRDFIRREKNETNDNTDIK